MILSSSTLTVTSVGTNGFSSINFQILFHIQSWDADQRFNCACNNTCFHDTVKLQTVQYAQQSAMIKSRLPPETRINSIYIEMDSLKKTYIESADYPFSRFMSDVGGSLAFFMGFSAPTIIIFLEKILIKTINQVQVSFNRNFYILTKISLTLETNG